MKTYEKYLNENTLLDQQKKFKKQIPKVEYVLKKHMKVLTGKEKKILKTYYNYITGKESVIDRFIKEEAETIILYLSRV